MPLYRDNGVILRTYRLAETDRIVVMLTQGHGKVRAVAKGVRRASSKFGGRLEPGSHCALQLREGRNLDIVAQAEAIETFNEIREDLELLVSAATVLETVDHLAQEGSPDARLYKMTVGVLRTLRDRPSALVVPAFFLRLLDAEGVGLSADVCVSCGESGVAVSAEAMRLLATITSGRVNEALAAPRSPATDEVSSIALAAIEAHVDRRLKAARIGTH